MFGGGRRVNSLERNLLFQSLRQSEALIHHLGAFGSIELKSRLLDSVLKLLLAILIIEAVIAIKRCVLNILVIVIKLLLAFGSLVLLKIIPSIRLIVKLWSLVPLVVLLLVVVVLTTLLVLELALLFMITIAFLALLEKLLTRVSLDGVVV